MQQKPIKFISFHVFSDSTRTVSGQLSHSYPWSVATHISEMGMQVGKVLKFKYPLTKILPSILLVLQTCLLKLDELYLTWHNLGKIIDQIPFNQKYETVQSIMFISLCTEQGWFCKRWYGHICMVRKTHITQLCSDRCPFLLVTASEELTFSALQVKYLCCASVLHIIWDTSVSSTAWSISSSHA